MPFSPSIKEEALVLSKRCCCLCRKFGGRNMNVHHIIPEAEGGPNILDNAIVLCLDCHAEVGHYNPNHPLGIKYQPTELKKRRKEWLDVCASDSFFFKEVSPEYILKQHNLVFMCWASDSSSLGRELRMKRRYDGSHGIGQHVELAISYTTKFLNIVERDVVVEIGCGSTSDLLILFASLCAEDRQFLIQKVTAAYPKRSESNHFKSKIMDGTVAIKNIYSNFAVKVFGTDLPDEECESV